MSLSKTLACAIAFGALLQAFEPTLDTRTLERAIDIGRSRFDAERIALHRLYRIDVGRAPVDWIDVVTPFRRVVLEAEVHSLSGGRLFGQREALEALGQMPQRVDVVVEMTFHPLNTFIGVPSYDVSLVAAAPAGTSPTEAAVILRPQQLDRVLRFGARVTGNALPYPYQRGTGVPRGSEPLSGGVLVAQFDGQVLDPVGVYAVLVTDGATELARTRIDFRTLR